MEKIVIITKQGKIIKFDSKEAITQKRGGIGIRAMMVKDGDEIVSAFTTQE